MARETRVLLSENAAKVLDYLNKESPKSKIEKSILKALKKKTELIKYNPHYGNTISKKLFPKEIIRKYEITNLHRIELPNFWRMLYTIREGENKVEIIAFVIEICDHKKYNKLFRYN
jgi:hypothetical protein